MIKRNTNKSTAVKNKMRIKKGDTVVVIAGKYKGVKGKVLKAFPKTDRVIVEKVNFIKKHTRPSQQNQQGGIVEKEGTIHVSNVKLFNEKLGEVTRAVFKDTGDSRERVCVKSGDVI
jgi:large subunit ribosomal protein L24